MKVVMAAGKLAVALVLCLLVSTGSADYLGGRKSSQDLRQQHQVQECRLQKITAKQPGRQIKYEGGSYEIWDTQEDQLQCAGVAAMRVTVNPNSLCLPKYFPTPRLLYVVEGRGLLGLSIPGCPEAFHAFQHQATQQESRKDQHQRIHRVRRGDVIAIPPGVAHWSYNDGNKDLVFVSFNDVYSHHNQLDVNFRAFMLAGGQRSQGQSVKGRPGEREDRPEDFTFQNVLNPLDERILAESLNVPTELAQRIQSSADRGLIVRCDEEMRSLIAPDEELQERRSRPEGPPVFNGFEESYCSMQIRYNARTSKTADIYNQDAGKINIVNRLKLPILESLDVSLEKGQLLPGAVYAPHWSMTDNRAIYAIRGSLNVQIVDDYGNTVMNEKVQEGDLFVIPQFYASVSVAGPEGFEWVTFKTSGLAAKNPMAGYTSVMRAMPIDVLTNAYQFSSSEAQRVKTNRDPEQVLFAPTNNSPWRGMIKLPTSN